MIKNLTNGMILARKTKNCETFLSKARGLMFSKKKQDFGLIFYFSKEEIVPITMLFVFHPIDILWLDQNKKVVAFRENLQPFLFSITPNEKAKYVIELPSGTIKKSTTKINHKISF